MSFDKDTVARIAVLARLPVPDAELEVVTGELRQILRWVEQLGEVDTAGIEPMARVVDMTLPMRDDVVTDGDIRDAVLSNASEATDRFFTVPKVVE